MDYVSYNHCLQRILELVKFKRTGTPKALAQKLNVSERTLRRMIAHLKEEGIAIRYNRSIQSYTINLHLTNSDYQN
ncbi:MAG: HTH domain-containing protein [Bacteroidetes bacterium]|nr:HTH domain-containing protein [Bacteroidota bacterium]